MSPHSSTRVAGGAALTDAHAAASFPAICPLCHTANALLTEEALAAGAGWCCTTCRAHWNGARVATVMAYRAWLREHRPAPSAP